MTKVQIIALQSYRKPVLDYLQKLGVFEVIEDQNQEKFALNKETIKDLEKKIVELDFIIQFLTPYYKDNRGFKYALFRGKESFSEKRVEEIAKQLNFQELVTKVQDIEVRQNTLKTEIQDVTMSYASATVNHVESTHSAPSYNSSFLSAAVDDATLPNTSTPAGGFNAEAIKATLSEKPQVKKMHEEKPAQEVELRKLEKDCYELAQELPKLRACYDYFTWEIEQEKVAAQVYHTDYTFILTGWLQSNQVKKAKMELAQLTDNSATIEDLEHEEGEEAPIKIENHPIFKPFEIVTRMYALPKVHELDPTPFLALFFIVYFGLCLTDALYGLLLTIVCFGALVFMKIPQDIKGPLWLLGSGGIVTVVLGVLFGGYAGIPVEYIPQFLLDLQLFDTTQTQGIMLAMGLALGLGFFQLWFGTLIGFFAKWRSGNRMEAVCMNLSWTIFFAIIAASQFLVKDAQMSKYTIYAGIAFISLCLAWDTKNVFMKFIVGPFKLFQEIINWGSNILSYARLFALGLATGVIAMVFNQIGGIMGGMLPPVIGYPVMILIIIFGHILNIAINILGAFIHSARLQFVEFFSRFYEGGGRAFQPFSRKSVHTISE